jgi:O-antigen ligase
MFDRHIGFAITFIALTVYSRSGISYDIPATCFLAFTMGVAIYICAPPIASQWGMLLLASTLASAVYFGAGSYVSYVLLAACAFVIFLSSALLGQVCHSNTKLRSGLAYGLVAAALFNAGAGIIQYLGFSQLLGGLVLVTTDTGRAHGNLGQSNHLATLCCIALVVLRASLESSHLTAGLDTSVKTKKKRQYIGVLWALGLAIGLSISRTGLLQLVMLVLLFLTWWKIKDDQHWFVGHLLAAYMVAQTLFPALLSLIGENASHMGGRVIEGSSGRLTVWAQTLELIRQKPFTGWGWREFGYARYINMQGASGGQYFDNAHNFVLQLAVELGLIRTGLVLLVPIVYLYIFKPWQAKKASVRTAWTVFLLLIIHGLLELPLWHPKFLLLLGLSMGFMFLYQPNVQPKKPVILKLYRAFSRPWISKVYAAILLSLSIWVAQDYVWVSQPYFDVSMRLRSYAETPLDATKNAVFFVPHADFATLSLTKTSEENAQEINDLANRLLHFEATPIVIGALVESYWILGDKEKVNYHAERYKKLYSSMYEVNLRAWKKTSPDLFIFLKDKLPIA